MFLQERDKGNTRVIGGSPGVGHSNSHPVSPIFPANLLEMSTPQIQKAKMSASLARTSSPQISSDSPLIQHTQTPIRHRSPSPVVIHANVSYIRGPLMPPNISPRAAQRTPPRVELRTPPEIEPYPSDNESTHRVYSPPMILNRTDTSQSPRYKFKQQYDCASPMQRSSSAPVSPKASMANATRSSPHRAIVKTPSVLNSYQELTPETTSDPLRLGGGNFLLSPLNSPRFFTSDDMSGHMSGRSFSRHAPPRARKSASISSSPSKSPQSGEALCNGNIIPSQGYIIPPYPDDHSQCQHTCPRCKHASTYIIGAMPSLNTPRSPEGNFPKALVDPRSPMSKKYFVPGSVTCVYLCI